MLWWSQIRNPGMSRERASTHVRTQWRPWQAQDSGVATLVGHAAPRYRPPWVRAVGRRRSSGEEVGGGEMEERAGGDEKGVAIGTTPNPQRSRTPGFLCQPLAETSSQPPQGALSYISLLYPFPNCSLTYRCPFFDSYPSASFAVAMILVFHSRKKRCFASRSLYRGAEIKEFAVVFVERLFEDSD